MSAGAEMNAALALFTKQIFDFNKKLIPAQTILLVKKAAFQLLEGFIFTTPVKLGRARGGWQLDLNVEPVGETGILDRDGSATLAKGSARLAQYKFGDSVYITNNVPYIIPLEEGHGAKNQPHAIIAATLARIGEQFI